MATTLKFDKGTINTTSKRAPRGTCEKIQRILKESPDLEPNTIAGMCSCSIITVYNVRSKMRGQKGNNLPLPPSSNHNELEGFLKSVLKTFSSDKAVKIIKAMIE